MRKRTILYSLLLVTILITGCIKDDLDDCPPAFSLYFSYKGDGTREMFLEKDKSVVLYIYNDKELLIKTIALDESDLKRKQGVDIDLPEGKYHVVCWGNSDKDTQISQNESLDLSVIGATGYYTGEAITSNDSLYYGSKDINILRNNSVKVDTVKFKSIHFGVRIITNELNTPASSGNTRATSESAFRVEIGNLTPTVNFKEVYSSEKVSYYPTSALDKDNEFQSSFNVLRFDDDNDVYINLRNKETDSITYTMPLKDFMQKNNITVNGKNEVVIGIKFTFTGMNVVVKPWEEEDITPGT